jgi:hypothetical protein
VIVKMCDFRSRVDGTARGGGPWVDESPSSPVPGGPSSSTCSLHSTDSRSSFTYKSDAK